MTEREALKLALKALEIGLTLIEDFGSTEQLNAQHKAITAIKEALANEALDKMAENARELGLDYEPAQPEFIKHEVKNADDWSEWVCPDPKNYLMKCCDCGLVHEAQFGVVRYKSETEREDCDIVDDPNLQAVFRMRRSEEWTPEDTAHRSGGLPMAQPEHEPCCYGGIAHDCHAGVGCRIAERLKPTTPPQRKPLSDEQLKEIWLNGKDHGDDWLDVQGIARAIEAAHGIKGEA